MISTQVVESSFNNSSFQNYPHPDDYTKGHTCIYADYKFYNSWVQKHGDRGAGEQEPIEEFMKGGIVHPNNFQRYRRGWRATSFPGSSLFLPRESTLFAAGHVSMYTNEIRTEGGSLT